MKGQDVVKYAEKFIGNSYVFGVLVPKEDKNYDGAFDCAEFTTYCNYQTYGIMYGARGKNHDAYTGFYAEDAEKLGKMISVEEAARTPGAMLLRRPVAGAIGHIAFSLGNGKTVEAYNTKEGVIHHIVSGRRWSTGLLLPTGVEYKANEPVITKPPSIVYRLKSPYMRDPFVARIQQKLNISADGIYGPGTQAAVVAYQKKAGLIADGEVMPGGQTARSLGIL